MQGTTTEDGILFRFKAFESDYYGTPAHFQWVFGMTDRRQLLGMTKVDVVTEERAMEGEPAVSKGAQTPRGPIPMLNGKPFFFNILTACTSTMDNHYFVTGMEGADSPFNVVAARLGGMTNLWWVGPDQYDFTEVDRTLNSILQHYPDSMLGLYVWCQPGGWYGRMYPERMSHMEDGSIYGYYVSAIDFANAEYRADAARALTALMNHLETFFGPKTFIYNLMGGISCEWQGWASHSDQYADFSQGGTREFLEYAAQNGVNATAVPGRQEREATVDGIFRNPARDEIAILYDRYYSESIAECVEILAAAAKKACGRNKLVGCYYGYLMEYANLGHCVNGGGHNALQRLLDNNCRIAGSSSSLPPTSGSWFNGVACASDIPTFLFRTFRVHSMFRVCSKSVLKVRCVRVSSSIMENFPALKIAPYGFMSAFGAPRLRMP